MKIVIVGYTGFIGNIIYQKLERTKEYDLTGISTKEIDLTEEKVPDEEEFLRRSDHHRSMPLPAVQHRQSVQFLKRE